MLKLFALIVLILMMVSAAGLAGNVAAREVNIKTSADGHDSKFFGEGVLQVLLTDSDANDDNTVEHVKVDVTADPHSSSADSASFTVPETSRSSGIFEFFIVHANSTAVEQGDLDSLNSVGVQGDGVCVADCAPVITFGPGGDLDITSALYNEVVFDIFAADTEITVNYEETMGTLKLDRDSYGTDSFVYISIVDGDADLNPTARDQFTVDPNSDMLELEGGTLETGVIFKETGDNTGVFEGTYKLGDSMSASSKSLILTLHEKANYDETLAAPENNSNKVDSISFTVGNSDGSIGGQQQQQKQPLPTSDPILQTDKVSYSAGESVHITITDQDANVNPSAADSIKLQVLSGFNKIWVSAIETDINTGVFQASFRLANNTRQDSNSIAIDRSITILYTDRRPADYYTSVGAGHNPQKDFILKINVKLPIKIGTEATNVTAPMIKNNTGTTVILSTKITNNNNRSQPFIGLIEVRDNIGITVFLAIWNGTLDPLLSTEVGTVWQPEHDGVFELRSFVISSLSGEAEPLSLPATSKVMINSHT
jgi:hypothetical protein